MAMLAEPKRRSKYSVDPRGLNWSKDDDKFGQKMLEKMGWKHGKGLGAQEDGMTDHIAVKHKFDSRGVGCSKSYADNWIGHQDDFNALLSTLNETSDCGHQANNENAVSSLELKSKNSKGRVHYMKFTKGKDLSSKNNHDLDCVFGRRKSKSAPATPQMLSETESAENSDSERNLTDNSSSGVDKSHGVVTVKNNLSVSDYFAQKMLEVKARLKKVSDDNSAETKQVEQLGQRSKVTETHQEERNMGRSSDAEKQGEGVKVMEDLGMIRSHTAPSSLQSMAGAESDVDDKPGTETEKVRGKSKKGKRRKQVKDGNGEADLAVDPEMIDWQKRKRKAEKVGIEQVLVHDETCHCVEGSTERTKKKKRKRNNVEENFVDCDTDDTLNGVAVEADRQDCRQIVDNVSKYDIEGKDSNTQHENSVRSTRKEKKHEKCGKTVESASGGSALEVTEKSWDIETIDKDKGSSSKSKEEEPSLGKGVASIGDDGQDNSQRKEKPKKKGQKKKKQMVQEKVSEREDYVKIPSCVNKKRLREQQAAVKEAVRAEEKEKELGFVGSNLGDVVGYGRVDTSLDSVNLQELRVATKKKKNKAKKKCV